MYSAAKHSTNRWRGIILLNATLCLKTENPPETRYPPPGDNDPPRWQSGCYLCPSLQDSAPWHTAKTAQAWPRKLKSSGRRPAFKFPRSKSDQASVGCAGAGPVHGGPAVGGLIGVLIRASFKSDAIFSLVFWDNLDSTHWSSAAYHFWRHRGSDSRRSVFNRFGPPVIINVVNFQNLTAHFARKLLFWFSFPTPQIWRFWIEGRVGRHPAVSVVWQVGQETQKNKFPTNWTFLIYECSCLASRLWRQ